LRNNAKQKLDWRVQLRDTIDPESGERYTVKRYESGNIQTGDSWRHSKITLKPINPKFEPIILTETYEGQAKVVAELVEVLGAANSPLTKAVWSFWSTKRFLASPPKTSVESRPFAISGRFLWW
jgi:hypothetical protein